MLNVKRQLRLSLTLVCRGWKKGRRTTLFAGQVGALVPMIPYLAGANMVLWNIISVTCNNLPVFPSVHF